MTSLTAEVNIQYQRPQCLIGHQGFKMHMIDREGEMRKMLVHAKHMFIVYNINELAFVRPLRKFGIQPHH